MALSPSTRIRNGQRNKAVSSLSPPPLTLSHVEIQNKETHSLHIPYSCSTRNTDKEKKANKDLQDYTLQQYIQPFYELQDNQGSLTHNNG